MMLIATMQPGTCLISMLHYPTRPRRVALLKEIGLEAISLDSIKDDVGRRLIENLRAVAWNGVEVAFQSIERALPSAGSGRSEPLAHQSNRARRWRGGYVCHPGCNSLWE